MGVDFYLQKMYNEIHPYRFLKVYNRQALRQHANTVYPFSTGEKIEIPSPRNTFECKYLDQFNKISGTYEFEQPFVAEIDNGKILEKHGLATTQDYTLLLDSASSREGKIKWRMDYDLLWQSLINQRVNVSSSSNSTHIETAVSLIRAPFQLPAGRTTLASKGYSHWVQSYLTLLQGIEAYEKQTGRRPTIIIEPDPPSWLLESLEFFGFCSNDLHIWDPDERIFVTQLVVPSVRRVERTVDYNKDKLGSQHKILSRDACQWLHKRVVNQNTIDASKSNYSSKVFISRSDADRRRIQNSRVFEELHDRGFESYELSKLSFPEQVALFAQATDIVGVHGAGLANIVFASDCSVIEIVGDSFKPTYYILTEILDLEYKLISGQSIKQPGVSTHHQDIEIRIEQLDDI